MNIPLFKVFMDKNVSVDSVLQSGYIGQGTKVDEFEKKISDYIGSPYVNTLNSATSGIHLALRIIKDMHSNDGERDEVITTPLTCTATNFPIVANSLKIKWADLDINTCNIDLDDVMRKITPKTLAIMVVHWGGYPVDLDKLKHIQSECLRLYGFAPPIIEDCAHAMGSMYKYQKIGSSGNYCVFSFQAIKHLTTGDGGLLVCPSDSTNKKAKLLRWYGLDRTSSADFRCEQNISDWGYKFHMNDIAATIGLGNLPYLNDLVSKHHDNHQWLQNKLKTVPHMRVMKNSPEYYSASWVLTLLVEGRDNFMQKMKSHGIGVSRVHDRNDKHDCLKDFRAFLPTTDIVCDLICCIPCGWWVTEEDRQYIYDCILKGW